MKLLTDDVKGKLKHVRASRGRLSLEYFPDYLIVGPQRTGTTWLAKILWRHPQVFMSFPKELYFFNLLDDPNHKFYRSNDLSWYLRHLRDNPISYVIKNVMAIRRFGELYSPVVRGESTASYAALDPDVIAEVVALNPDIRVILMVRDPVTRAWSHAKKDLVRDSGRTMSQVSAGEFETFFRAPYQVACGNFTKMIGNWTVALRPGNLFVGRFDDVAGRPKDLLLDVFRFLGVASDEKYVTEYAGVRVNSTEDADLPDQYRLLLEDLFAAEKRRLEANFGFDWHRR